MKKKTPKPQSVRWYEVVDRDGLTLEWEIKTLRVARIERARLDALRPASAPFRITRVTETREEVT